MMTYIAKYILASIIGAIVFFFFVVLAIQLTSCSLNMTMVTTRGAAENVADDATTENVKPALQIPLK